MATPYCGYMGKVALVDMTTQTITDYPWTDRERELFIGGKIMAAKILCDQLTGKEEPYSEENLLVITTGPLTGTGAPISSRFNISTLSPQTGFITSSNCGGSFGYHLKRAGYDALVLRGRCQAHTWLAIHNDHFVFHPDTAITAKDIDGCIISVNGKAGKKNTKLADGDEVMLMSPVCGG